VDEYLASYSTRLPSKIDVKWCLPEPKSQFRLLLAVCTSTFKSGFWVEAPHDSFCRGYLAHFKVLPPQLMLGAWQTVLGFEAFCATYASVSYGVKEFCTVCMMRKSHYEAFSLIPRSGCDMLIIILVDVDHEWCNTVVLVSRPWGLPQSRIVGVFLSRGTGVHSLRWER